MANIHEIKHRIKSIRETKQITRAMKLISAAKLKRARQQLEQTTPYFNKIRETMMDILMHSKGVDNNYFDSNPNKGKKKKGLIVITGDKGLAGSYNNNVIRLAEQYIGENPDIGIFLIGYMGKLHFTRKKYNIDMEFDFYLQNPNIYRAKDISNVMINLFSEGHIDEIYVIYTKMVSSVKIEPAIVKLLPLGLDQFIDPEAEVVEADEELIYEPSPNEVLNVLVPKYLKGVIYSILVESFTSEQCARMMAMDSATKNAEEMLEKLNLIYNKARQAAITQEISEVVGGAAALS